MTDQELSDAFNAALSHWMRSVPGAAQYARSLGYSLTGLHNMLFYFFKAGHNLVTIPVEENRP